MPDRIRTAEDVSRILAELCRGRGAYAATPLEVERQVNWRRRFLAHDREAWAALMIRCQCRAAGIPATARYRALGWTPRRYEAAWRRGAQAIVEGLARETHNPAAIDAALDADERLEARGRIRPRCGPAPLYETA